MKPKQILSCMFLLLASITAHAYGVVIDGIRYELSLSDWNATVTGYGENFSSGDVVIPETVQYKVSGYGIKTFNVTSIGDGAFSWCSELTSVTIPNSVTSIGSDAFQYCEGLTSVVIPNSVTNISDYVFSECRSLTSISVSQGNAKYDSRDNCNAIIETSTNKLIVGCKNTTIPNDITCIGKGAFDGCTGLTTLVIPASVTSIGEDAFIGCSGLTSISIPNSVTTIDYYAFGQSGLTSITIPNSVTSIGEGAFYDCNDLKSVTIGNGVTSIGQDAFCCNSLIDVKCMANTPKFTYAWIDNEGFLITVPDEGVQAYKSAWPNYANNTCWRN